MTDIEILKQLGGIRPAARKLGHRNHTTVQGWWDRNRIPPDRRPEVERVLAEQAA
ncbi:carph-isopro domain-containing protein [Sphingopyxis sp. 22461]|uniref:carph-isopro domain-containing protein n=1 Tax=Sphingopyxis sp. 22461 TaxID=3453923 RepID=UPI003F86CE42